MIVHHILQQCIRDRLAILNGSWGTKPLPCASQGQEWCLSAMLGRNQPKRKYRIHAGRGDPSNFFQEGTGYTRTCWVPIPPWSKRGLQKRFLLRFQAELKIGNLEISLSLSLSLQPVKSLSNHSILLLALAALTVHE